MRRTWLPVIVAAGVTLATLAPAASAATAAPAAAAPAAAPVVRVNQVGYPTAGSKVAYVMLARPVRSVKFEVADDYTAASLFAFALGGDQGSGLG